MYLEPLTILVPTHIRTIHTSFSHNYNISLLWFSSIVNNVDIGIMELWHLVYLSITKFWNSQQIFYIYVYLYTYYITIILTSWINKYVCRTQQRLNRRRQNEIMAKIQAAIIQIPKPEPNRTLKALEAQKLMKKKKEAEVSCGHLLLSFLLNIGFFFFVMCRNLLKVCIFFSKYPWSFLFLSKIPPVCVHSIHFTIVCSVTGCNFRPGRSNSQCRNVYLDSCVYRESDMMQLWTHHSSLPCNVICYESKKCSLTCCW